MPTEYTAPIISIIKGQQMAAFWRLSVGWLRWKESYQTNKHPIISQINAASCLHGTIRIERRKIR